MSTSPRRRLFAWPHELSEAGVLGINHRNLAFIQESNPRQLYPRVDDKTITKGICHATRHSGAGNVRRHPPLRRRAAISRS